MGVPRLDSDLVHSRCLDTQRFSSSPFVRPRKPVFTDSAMASVLWALLLVCGLRLHRCLGPAI